jgi:hypothetical protein
MAASFAVAYCTDAEGDADDDPAAAGVGLPLVCPQPVNRSKAEDKPNTRSKLERDIFAAEYRMKQS